MSKELKPRLEVTLAEETEKFIRELCTNGKIHEAQNHIRSHSTYLSPEEIKIFIENVDVHKQRNERDAAVLVCHYIGNGVADPIVSNLLFKFINAFPDSSERNEVRHNIHEMHAQALN